MTYETDKWPYLEARYHGPERTVSPRLIVIHTPTWAEKTGSAQAVANYFRTMADGRVASAHIIVDNQQVWQSVLDSAVAWAAPNANRDGLHIEIVGTDLQTRPQWRDAFSLATLALAADAAAQWCIKYDIPAIKLTDAQLQGGSRGFVGHDQVSRVYKKSDHTDPGPNFPWDRFIFYVKGAYMERTRL